MHFHAIILAALSAGALSISLTAKNLTNSNNKPNVKCEGKDNGMNVYIDQKKCPENNPDCNCWLYEPPEGSYIWVDYMDETDALNTIHVFSDTHCKKNLTTLVPSKANVYAYKYATSGTDSGCVFMGPGVKWGSVMANNGSDYWGSGV